MWYYTGCNSSNFIVGCLDYIWYSKATLRAESYLEPLAQTDSALAESKGFLPNQEYSSDHYCIGAILSYTSPAEPGKKVHDSSNTREQPIAQSASAPSEGSQDCK